MGLEKRLYVIVGLGAGGMMAISGLIQLLLYLLIGGLVVYLCYWIIGMLTLPQPVKNVICVIVAIIVLPWLLGAAGIVPRMW